MAKLEKIIDALNNMDTGDLVAIHNEYCDAVHYYDDRIYYMEEFDDLFYGKTPLEIVDAVNSCFSSCDNYFSFDGCGFANSFDYPDIDIDVIAEYIDDNNDYLYNDEIQEILDEYDDDNDDDENE